MGDLKVETVKETKENDLVGRFTLQALTGLKLESNALDNFRKENSPKNASTNEDLGVMLLGNLLFDPKTKDVVQNKLKEIYETVKDDKILGPKVANALAEIDKAFTTDKGNQEQHLKKAAEEIFSIVEKDKDGTSAKSLTKMLGDIHFTEAFAAMNQGMKNAEEYQKNPPIVFSPTSPKVPVLRPVIPDSPKATYTFDASLLKDGTPYEGLALLSTALQTSPESLASFNGAIKNLEKDLKKDPANAKLVTQLEALHSFLNAATPAEMEKKGNEFITLLGKNPKIAFNSLMERISKQFEKQ